MHVTRSLIVRQMGGNALMFAFRLMQSPDTLKHHFHARGRPASPFYTIQQPQSAAMAPLGLIAFGVTTILLQVPRLTFNKLSNGVFSGQYSLDIRSRSMCCTYNDFTQLPYEPYDCFLHAPRNSSTMEALTTAAQQRIVHLVDLVPVPADNSE